MINHHHIIIRNNNKTIIAEDRSFQTYWSCRLVPYCIWYIYMQSSTSTFLLPQSTYRIIYSIITHHCFRPCPRSSPSYNAPSSLLQDLPLIGVSYLLPPPYTEPSVHFPASSTHQQNLLSCACHIFDFSINKACARITRKLHLTH